MKELLTYINVKKYRIIYSVHIMQAEGKKDYNKETKKLYVTINDDNRQRQPSPE